MMRRGRWARCVVAAGVLLGCIGVDGAAAPGAQAASDPSVPVAQIALDRAVYDRYQPVVIQLGAIGFFPSCPGGGVRDFIYPWADIYIVRGQVGSTLTDVSGQPNAVIGFGGGGFFDEVIGYAGVGALTSGTYSIVVDECQDGRLDPNDAVFPNAFRVTVKTAVQPLVGIASLKANAGQLADSWTSRGREWKALLAMNEALEYVTPFLTNPPLVAIGIGISQFISTQISNLATGAFPDPKEIVATHNTQMARHYRAIQLDPPDPAFAQLTPIPASVVTGAVYADPIFEAAATLSRSTAAEGALAEALLHAIERYQGAAAARDGVWALRHAREAQQYASLLADQLVDSAAGMAAASAAVAADPRDIDGVLDQLGAAYATAFTTGLTAEQEALIVRSGISRADVTRTVAELWRLDLAGIERADMVATLDTLAAASTALAAQLDTFAAANQATIDGLAADPNVVDLAPVVDAGGPYAATVGAPVTVSATATGPDAVAGWAWDLDGDGAFDDATGASVTMTPAIARVGTVSARTTSTSGEVGIGVARIVVADGTPPTPASVAPAEDGLTLPIGVAQQFTFSTPAGSTQWWVDGIAAATGPTFDYVPAAAGTHRVRATVEAGSGLARDWTVLVVHPDLDGDGYPADVDCDDAAPAVHPGAPELLDGIDNDCNPASPDGGADPGVTVTAPPGGSEGSVSALAATIVPSGATAPFTATVDWGDGEVTPAAVSGTAVTASHAYRDDGDFPVAVCVTSAGQRRTCAETTATITNAAPTPEFVSLRDWIDEGHPIDSDQGLANWALAADALSVTQTINADPGFYVSPEPLIGTEAQVTIEVLPNTGDDDFIGFVLGVAPGFGSDPNARWIVVDWKAANQAYQSCNGNIAERGLAVSYVQGIPNDADLWNHAECTPAQPGSLTELARGATRGSTAWARGVAYQFRFEYTADRLRIWVNGTLEFDLAGAAIAAIEPGRGFPLGNLGFYNFSQEGVRYSAYQQTALLGVEGTPLTIVADVRDPGKDDTHLGRFDFGDGTPEEAATIAITDGVGTATTTHTFAENGTTSAELCITDDDGGVGCRTIEMRIANAAPVVDAGRDRDEGATVTLDDTTFSDLGAQDTHTATVDWGDGTVDDPGAGVTVNSTQGSGDVAAAHTYAADGTFTVTVCVTDDDGGTGCDTFAVVVSAAPAAPAVQFAGETTTVPEGTPVELGVGFTDPNRSGSHTVTIDWGDGASGPVTVQSASGAGSGGAGHAYADDGTYEAQAQVCDGTTCVQRSLTVTVTNAPPVPQVTATVPATPGLDVTIEAPFTDPGDADTHTATVDWGDGSTGTLARGGTGGPSLVAGSFAGGHRYAAGGQYTIEVCVTDDDEGRACATATAAIVAPEGTPPTVPSTTSTTTTTTTTITTTTTAPADPAPSTTSATTTATVEASTTSSSVAVAGPTLPTTAPPTVSIPTRGALPTTGGSGFDRTLAWGGLLVVSGVCLVVLRRQRRRAHM